MKQLTAWILVLALLLSGCAGESPQTAEEESTIVVGISQVGAESDWRVANSESLKAAFPEEEGYRLLFEDARQIQENQIMAVRRFIQQQVDYIVLLPICETGWDSVLQEAREAGIPVILADRRIETQDETLYAAHVGSDCYGQGVKAAQWIYETYGESTVNIIHIQGTLGSTPQLGRTKALEDEVARRENWQILTQLDGDFTQAKAYEALGQYLDTLEEGQRIDIVYCENDNEAFGAIEALEERGYVCGEDVAILSFDATRTALNLCLEGKIALCVECNPLLGQVVADTIRTMEAGGTPPKEHFVTEAVFSGENLTRERIEERAY